MQTRKKKIFRYMSNETDKIRPNKQIRFKSTKSIGKKIAVKLKIIIIKIIHT